MHFVLDHCKERNGYAWDMFDGEEKVASSKAYKTGREADDALMSMLNDKWNKGHDGVIRGVKAQKTAIADTEEAEDIDGETTSVASDLVDQLDRFTDESCDGSD